jgi:DNA-binding NarL/FixJ family response regulator
MAKKAEADLSAQTKQLLSINEQILDTLVMLVKVTAVQVGEGQSITERARALKLIGMDNKTIADVLNTSPKTISVVTANLRKSKAKAPRSRKAGRR